MAVVFYNQNPKISDTILFDLVTTGFDGMPIDVYEVVNVTIYFIERSRTPANPGVLPVDNNTNNFLSAVPVAVFGDETTPAWTVLDPGNSILTKEDFDSEGNPQDGVYRLTWFPDLVREGDFVVCYKWIAMPAGDEQLNSIPFYILGDTAVTTVIPTHYTVPGKYEMLINRYLPQTYRTHISGSDITPEMLEIVNNAIAKGFTNLEDLTNQIIDLFDANAVKDRTLPYLANLFNLKLRSSDTQLWRRQIKEAVPLFKKKGTLVGLKEALSAAGINLLNLTQLWQVKSSSIWTDAFFVTDSNEFVLTKLAILPIDPNNFEVSIRFSGDTEYQSLSSDYVSLQTVDGKTIATWVGDQLSFDPISLSVGDVVKILYKIGSVVDQGVEDYIKTLPLFDLRPEEEGLLPVKNWNVKVVEETDDMFPLLCPVKHPFAEPVVWGKLRTEMVYSEKAYNMDSYNGSVRDSTEPCSMDKSWQEPCSCCLSSKFVIDLEVSDFSGQRMVEAEEILNEYKPFHAVPHRINFLSGVDDFVLSPQEDVEFLINFVQSDDVLMTQDGFNRLIPEGAEQDSQLPNRSSLATTSTIYSGSGNGTNESVVFYSPGVDFRSLPLDTNGDNLLEILAGSDAGRYEVEPFSNYLIKLIQGSPDSTGDPLDMSEVPYRLSNVLHTQNDASIYQDNAYFFSDENLDILLYPIQTGWKIVITSGIYTGSYNISGVNSDNSISLVSFPSNAGNLNYQLQTNTSVVVFSGNSGAVSVENRGRVELDSVVNQINSGDYVEYSGTQYLVLSAENDLIISGYSGGNVVGAASVNVLRRLSFGVGFLNYNGMILSGVVPSVDNSLENNKFLENYTILIGSNYYQIESINGSDMAISGPMLFWGLSGTSVSYSIVQYIKTSPYTVPTTGVTFDRLDRRGNDQVTIETEISAMPMWSESFGQSEQVNITIEYR